MTVIVDIGRLIRIQLIPQLEPMLSIYPSHPCGPLPSPALQLKRINLILSVYRCCTWRRMALVPLRLTSFPRTTEEGQLMLFLLVEVQTSEIVSPQ